MNPEIYIDVPGSFALPSRYLRLRGWCFLAGTTLDRVQLVLPDRILFGRYGTARPDVRASLPQAPDDFIGFEVWANIPAGRHRAELQFRSAPGEWHTALQFEISAPKAWASRWFGARDALDLVEFQLGTRATHAPRPVVTERFPKTRKRPDRPRICVVTPSFNQRRYLAETIDSVLAQPEVDLFYRVQDGGSTDGSVDLIRAQAHRLNTWESAHDDGQADAIAKSFATMPGQPDDLMAWLNSDDLYLPGALAFVSDYFARHPEIDVLYGDRVLIDEDSWEIGRWFLPSHDDEVLKLNDYVPQETLFWRRRIWDRVGGLNPAFKFAMDWDLLLRFQAAGARIVHVPYFLGCFRVHPAQKTSAQMESLGDHEINELRKRSQGRALTHAEFVGHPAQLNYLRRSARLEFLRKFGLRGR